MNQIISTFLTPLNKYLQMPDLNEINITQEKFINLSFNSHSKRIYDEHFNYAYWYNLCHMLANYHGIIFDTTNPRVSLNLPGDHRLEGLLGYNIKNKISISIRINKNTNLQLTDFGLNQTSIQTIHAKFNAGCNCIISGSTNAGKTTFIKALLNLFNKHTRILSIEDCIEINLAEYPYSSQYIINNNSNKLHHEYKYLINHILRSRPELIIVGELSIHNIMLIIKLLNSGHHGFITSVHSNSSIESIIQAFEQNAALAGLNPDNLSRWLTKCINLSIHLTNAQGKVNANIINETNICY